MQYGHFDDKAREYVITRPDTPRPWSNYLGSTEYGAIITNHAGGYSFYKSGATGRFLRMRFNSIPADQPGRLFYLRDQETGDFWTAAWQPVAKPLGRYKSICRHGTAYTIIESRYAGVATEALYFVPLGQTFEYWRLKVTNKSKRGRRLSVFTYCEFANLWNTYQDLVNLQYSLFITRATLEDGILGITCNPNYGFDGQDLTGCHRTWMALTGAPLAGVETTRERFLGSYGGYAAPEAVARGRCSNFLAEGDNVVGGQQADLVLAPGETREIIVLLGLGTVGSHGRKTVAEFGNSERCAAEFAKLKAAWHAPLASVQVKTPDPDLDHMVNVWNAYNALITYAWSRSASLIYNGERDGLGFRDTVQDMLGAIPLLREGVQPRLELMLTGQLANGGAIPVIKPFSHRPGRELPPPAEEYRSDDCLWFFNTVPAYVAETGDLDFYRKVLPYADAGEATVLGHLRRALEFNLERTGRNGLPCGLSADWNDCIKLGYKGGERLRGVPGPVRVGSLRRHRGEARRVRRGDLGAHRAAEARREDPAGLLGRRVVHLGDRAGRHDLRHERLPGGPGLHEHAGVGGHQRSRHPRSGDARAANHEGAPRHALRRDALRAALHQGRPRDHEGHALQCGD